MKRFTGMTLVIGAIFIAPSAVAGGPALADSADARTCFAETGAPARHACRRWARAVRGDAHQLLSGAARLEAAGRYAAAVNVYDEGLKVGVGRESLARRRALALSHLEERRRVRKPALADNVRVRRRIAAIKCLHLSAARNTAACRDVDQVDAAAGTEAVPNSAAAHPAVAASIRTNPETPGLPLSAVVVERLDLLITLREKGLIDGEEFARRRAGLLDTAFLSGSPAVADVAAAGPTRGIDAGGYHALVIGNNDYREFPRLVTAIRDARSVAELLRDEYGFRVSELVDADRYAIVSALSKLRTTLKEDDNLLIYYAGHGYLDEITARGYWLPVDAEQDNYANWLSTADVADALNGMRVKHALVVADSCFSGSLSRGAHGPVLTTVDERRALIERLLAKRSRTVLSSGGLEPVLDSGGGDHSVFARAFLDVLHENTGPLEASRLFTLLRERVVFDVDQTPEYAAIRHAGHQGGDFVFVRRSH